MPNGAGSCPDFRLVEGSSLSIRRTLTPEGCRCVGDELLDPTMQPAVQIGDRTHQSCGDVNILVVLDRFILGWTLFPPFDAGRRIRP